MSTFKAMKFRVDNPEHSQAIQEALFKLGYTWACGWGNNDVRYLESPFLFAETQGVIMHCSTEDGLLFYLEDKNTETTLVELHEMLETKQKNLEQNCSPNSESQITDNSISLYQLQKLISEAQVSVLIEGDTIKIWADNDVEVVAKDEADLLAKLEMFKAYNQMVNGGE